MTERETVGRAEAATRNRILNDEDGAEYRQALAAWIGLEWDHWLTLTFASPLRMESAARHFEQVFVRQLELRTQRRVDYFGSVERGAESGDVHIHALVSGTSILSCHALAACWLRGFSRVRLFSPSGFAAAYTCKTLAEEDSYMLLRDRRRSHACSSLRPQGARSARRRRSRRRSRRFL